MKSPKSILFLFFILVVAGIVGGLFFLKQTVGDIRPALLPTKKVMTDELASSPSELKKHTPSTLPLTVPKGYAFTVYATDLGLARDLTHLDHDIFVSIPNQGEVVMLRDKDDDGKADEQKVILSRLNNPHGIEFYQGKLYVAEETQLVRYHWDAKNSVATKDKKLFDLPQGGRHTTRTLAFDNNNNVYVSIGSTCDVCYEKDERISTVMISDIDGDNPRIFAKGLRNAPFITFHSPTNSLWGTEMGRDFLGDNLPPDEINIIREGKNYGWPICYGNKVHDTNFSKVKIDDPKKICANTESPIYEIPAHSAPLGLAFIPKEFSEEWQDDLLVAYHGSWNSSKPVGYKVVRMKVENGKIMGEEDFMTGFLPTNANGEAGSQVIGRPVDITFDIQFSMYVSDDKAGRIYKIFRTE